MDNLIQSSDVCKANQPFNDSWTNHSWNTSEATGHGQLNINPAMFAKQTSHLMIVGQIIHGILAKLQAMDNN